MEPSSCHMTCLVLQLAKGGGGVHAGAARSEGQAGIVALAAAQVLGARVEHSPHEAKHAGNHKEQGRVVDPKDLAGALASQARVDLRGAVRYGRSVNGDGGLNQGLRAVRTAPQRS